MKRATRKLKNGDIELTISFDITKHGHVLGEMRNYDIQQVTETIRNPVTQHHINVNLCLGYFGHSARQKNNNPHIAKEVDDNGNPVNVCSKVTGLKINKNIITYKVIVLNTEEGRKILKFLDSGIGGFSFAWSIEQGIFAGVDYVFSPNFVQNRILEGSICKGECDSTNIIKQMDFDSIGNISPDELTSFIRDSNPFLIIDNINNKRDEEVEEMRLLFDEVTMQLRLEIKKADNELLHIKKLLEEENLTISKDGIVFDEVFINKTFSKNIDVVLDKKLLEDLEYPVEKQGFNMEKFW